MTDERPPRGNEGSPAGDGRSRRRKRRRRGGRGEGPGADARAKPASPSTGAPSGSATASGESDPSTRRRRRKRRPSAQAASGASGGPAPRSRRRSRGPRPGRDHGQTGRESGADHVAPAEPTRIDPITVDDGWDDVPAAGPALAAEPARARARSESDSKTAWGDDSDAPTPNVTLAADLPADPPADDPDPTSYDSADLAPSTPGGGVEPAVRNPIGVKFATAGKIYLFDAGDDDYQVGEQVIVAGERGNRLGTVAVAPVRQSITEGPLRKVVRRPNARDREKLNSHEQEAADILRQARDIARAMKIPAKLFRADLGLGGGKVQIYVSGEEKIDTRRLAQELSRKLDLRIELRQTGVRDEAKMVGGIGSCGQELCCSTWLPSFVPVSIKNAKDQGLVLNPTKVSGQCGRLKCCLVYEQETYAAMRKGLPKLGKRVVTEAGEGRVVEVDVLHQRVRVSLVQGDVQVFAAAEVKPMFASQPQRKARPGGRRGSPPDDGPPSDA